MPKIHAYRPEGTYLMWLDCSQVARLSPKERDEWIINEAKLLARYGFHVWCRWRRLLNVLMSLALVRWCIRRRARSLGRAYEAKGF